MDHHAKQSPAPAAPDSPSQSSGEQVQPAKHNLRTALPAFGILLLAPVIAILLTSFVFQSYQVDGPSMQRTLYTGDRLVVWKLARSWARITRHQYVPKRGDIVIVTESGLASYGNAQDSKQLVKRVIGLPGDRVIIKNSVITVYNSGHPNGFQPDKTLRYGAHSAIPPTANNEDVTLAADELFICGDNRGDSLDSRSFGPIHTNQVIGTLAVRILPFSKIERF